MLPLLMGPLFIAKAGSKAADGSKEGLKAFGLVKRGLALFMSDQTHWATRRSAEEELVEEDGSAHVGVWMCDDAAVREAK